MRIIQYDEQACKPIVIIYQLMLIPLPFKHYIAKGISAGTVAEAPCQPL